MKVLDPGHMFALQQLDTDVPSVYGDPLIFVKREGPGYPGNVGHYAGTNMQEVLRALISRVKYLQTQIPCGENERMIEFLRRALFQLELRAAKRHGRSVATLGLQHIADDAHEQPLYSLRGIEDAPTCTGCGHIGCTGSHKEHTT